jgi:ATP-dependent RNA circularization protein (DNA/RNA ligase family)
MSSQLHKFPSTPHLAWLGRVPVRGDKVMDATEAGAFLSGPVVIEEKIDGANLGISLADDGRIRFQNRGNWLEGKLTGQWEPLRGWTARRERLLREHLPPGQVLFGEWCHACHSLGYDRLPDWFVAFDVLDIEAGRFWSVDRRDALLARLGMASVPRIAEGRLALRDVLSIAEGPSAFGQTSREGLYLRREDGPWLASRAKIVGAGFAQSIGEHWSNLPLVGNRVRAALAL